MATSGGRIYGGSYLPPVMIHHTTHPATTTTPCCSSQPPLDSFCLSGPSPSFLASSSMVSFEDVNNSSSKNKRSFFQSFEQDDNGDEDYDDFFNQSGKKRRLTVDQLKFLEKSFEMENKLEPDRKLQLAKDLGLQPRQVAIWFQNRRARWKTKQMERDFDVLQDSFYALKADYDTLFHENEDLKSQIALLSEEFARKQKGKNMLDALSEPSQPQVENPAAASISNSEESKVSIMASKINEMCNVIFDSDSTSTKKDNMFDTDNNYYMDGIHSPHMEHVDSSYILEPENNSDLSQGEEDSFSRGFLPSTPYRLPKLEPGAYSFASSSSASGHFGFPAFWSWSF
ncbi:unnamed protein product [Rhodiola kirilowii]